MTLEEALKLFKKASDVAGNYLEYVEIVSMHSINIVLSKIFNEHEAQLKAKDEEIERLKGALEVLTVMCELGIKTQDKYSKIIQKMKVLNKARSIVAMLFWEWRKAKRLFGSLSYTTVAIQRDFEEAYKMLAVT